MCAEYSFEVDPTRNLVRIRMSGFFTPDDIRDFVEARKGAHRQLSCEPNAHVTLNDIRGMKIQPQESVDAFREILSAPEYRSRRLAFIVSPTLARTQLARASASRDARWFENAWAAEAWLFAADAEVA